MSTLGAGSGKERSGAINLWIIILILSLVALGFNFYLSAQYSTEETKARDRIADIEVLSQQISKFAQEAASGGFEAFEELRSTRDRIQLNLDVLRQGSSVSVDRVSEEEIADC
jgi:twitching motility protein PilJ